MTEATLESTGSIGTSAAPGVLVRPYLSRREVDVLVAWLKVTTKEEAAEVLYISPSTVSTHIARIRAKYVAVGRPARTKIALLVRALQDGHIALDEV
nr:LuxR C-terminal-related transcriptional regulator [Tsukamurella pseudospumae]